LWFLPICMQSINQRPYKQLIIHCFNLAIPKQPESIHTAIEFAKKKKEKMKKKEKKFVHVYPSGIQFCHLQEEESHMLFGGKA